MRLHTETHQGSCPYCGETIELVIDCSVEQQDYIEDCQVCCRPITVMLRVNQQNMVEVQLYSENE